MSFGVAELRADDTLDQVIANADRDMYASRRDREGPVPSGMYLVVDGNMRLRAITALRSSNADLFRRVPAYITGHAQRFEIRYQTDICQDLLPSQLAALVPSRD